MLYECVGWLSSLSPAQHDYPEISGDLIGPSGPLEGVRRPSSQRQLSREADQVFPTRDGTFKFAPKRKFSSRWSLETA